MATQYTEYPSTLITRKLSWSGVFSGSFLFLAIEATFGVLGVAIFTQAINPHSASPIGPGISIGSGVWMIVLTMIALYFAGKLASTQSATTTRESGMYAGLVTFGMCVFASFLITSLALGNTFGRQITGVAPSGFTVADFIIIGGYWLFAAMVLGMIAAASGGIHGSRVDRLERPERTIETKRVA
jgi:hypothetical protein